jgi:hypothetical protein
MILIEELYKITVISNQTELDFITSDNPCINIAKNIEELKLYLPISPKKALFIEKLDISENDATELKKQVLSNINISKYFLDFITENDKENINQLNKIIWDNKESFAISSNVDILQNLIEQENTTLI